MPAATTQGSLALWLCYKLTGEQFSVELLVLYIPVKFTH